MDVALLEGSTCRRALSSESRSESLREDAETCSVAWY